MKKLLVLLLLGFVIHLTFGALISANADEYDPAKSIVVGVSLLTLPIAFTDQDLSVGHSWEIEGFSYAACDVGCRILPKKFWFMSPIFLAVLDSMYRTGELGQGQDNLIFRKWALDGIGILSSTVTRIEF